MISPWDSWALTAWPALSRVGCNAASFRGCDVWDGASTSLAQFAYRAVDAPSFSIFATLRLMPTSSKTHSPALAGLAACGIRANQPGSPENPTSRRQSRYRSKRFLPTQQRRPDGVPVVNNLVPDPGEREQSAIPPSPRRPVADPELLQKRRFVDETKHRFAAGGFFNFL